MRFQYHFAPTTQLIGPINPEGSSGESTLYVVILVEVMCSVAPGLRSLGEEGIEQAVDGVGRGAGRAVRTGAARASAGRGPASAIAARCWRF